ncbi:hypothetical protein GCM10011348_06300 [Marinobacterium nitratireducens]|uniref:DUF1415 domain-containing protein n=1 Tax=Marinobacterium nitratireducens TaxID=518897 RepID=A0A918DQ11_9GAMM|nr:DUF1415 domain-containing protein [Marinobacterium nitratireducens]GGO77239.1 hypothetical protein GCM10011348_06300 [Marinobacterium nitratireducens]
MKKRQHEYSNDEILALMKRWVEVMVVGENLCPFAAPDVRHDRVRYAISDARLPGSLVREFLAELDLIQRTPESEIATTLLVVPHLLDHFDDYLDMLAFCEDLLAEAGLDGVFQLASFHPGYLFEGVPEDDLSHWSNRAPFPTLHLIREGQMSRVLMHHPDPDAIPERNIAHLRELGRERLIELFPPFADYCD